MKDMKRSIKFKDLKIGDKFTCYGDVHINYNYPITCKCYKMDDDTGKEFDGIYFLMSDNDEVDPGWKIK